MRSEDLDLFQCPSCGSRRLLLRAMERDPDGAATAGSLDCQDCRMSLRIAGGIVEALPHRPEGRPLAESEAMERERRARDAQAEEYDRMKGLKLFGAVEIPLTLRLVRPDRSKTLVEVGCGTGRMTGAFARRSRRVVAIDFSLASLQRCRAKLLAQGLRNVTHVQADATALPLAGAVGDKVVSCQVLEHLPTPEARARMVGELARVAGPGGDIMVSAYRHDLLSRLFGQKEGEHKGGIYYYRFGRAELRELLQSKLTVRFMTGVLVYHYMVLASRTY
jgi:ubiquinone/menaquinone biosynthesis C-methylase UbiE